MVQNVFFFLQTKNKARYLYGNMNLKDAMRNMREHQYTAMPVIDADGEYLGSVSEGDFLWFFQDRPDSDPKQIELKEIIRPYFIPSQTSDVSMVDLFQQSLNQNFVPIVDDRNIFIGIVTRRSILSYLMEQTQNVEIVVTEKENVHA